MTLRVAWMALACLAAGSPVAAQDAPSGPASAAASESGTLALEIARLAYGSPDSLREASLASFEKSFRASFTEGMSRNENGKRLLAERPDVLEAALEAGKAEYARQFDALAYPQMMQDVAAIYSARLSEADIRQIHAFYATPEAQQFLKSFPRNPDGSPVVGQSAAANPMSSNPVIVKYQRSAAGRNEQDLSAEIAAAMVRSMQQSTLKMMPAVNAAIEAGLKAHLARTQAQRR